MKLQDAKDAVRVGVGSLIDRIRNDTNGLRILADWVGNNREPVDRALARKRADVCIACPRNQVGPAFERAAAEAILEQENLRKGNALTTPVDKQLQSCNVCGCHLKLKVWVPIQHIAPRSRLRDFPAHCWIQTEAKEKLAREVAELKGAPVPEIPKPVAPAIVGTRPKVQTFDVTVDRQDALGDSILASAVCSMLHAEGYKVGFWTAPGIRPIYENHPHLMPVDGCSGVHVNLNGAFEREEDRCGVNRRQSYFDRAVSELAKGGIVVSAKSLPRSTLVPDPTEQTDAIIKLIGFPRPFVAISPGSHMWANRKIPNDVWSEVCAGIKGTPIWVGKWDAPEGVFDAKVRTLKQLVAMLSACDSCITADTGPMHVALALGVRTTVVEGPFRAKLMLHLEDPWKSVSADIPCIGCGEFVCPLTEGKNLCVRPNPKSIIEAHERNQQSDAPAMV
jgi:ADP-heptose:LPS heptosyltransferase